MALQKSLPTQEDFDPWGGNLDAQRAWQHFGGLTLDEAKSRFLENPLYYQEDFMFMGGKAFAYYFAVIDDYLRNVPDVISEDDHEAWILSQCIRAQFDGDNLCHVRHLATAVLDLAAFVRSNIPRFGADGEERLRVADAWTDLARQIRSAAGQ